LYPDYQLSLWARIWWGFAFTFRVEDGKCKAVRRDRRGAGADADADADAAEHHR
jgi:hypothetical protein